MQLGKCSKAKKIIDTDLWIVDKVIDPFETSLGHRFVVEGRIHEIWIDSKETVKEGENIFRIGLRF